MQTRYIRKINGKEEEYFSAVKIYILLGFTPKAKEYKKWCKKNIIDNHSINKGIEYHIYPDGLLVLKKDFMHKLVRKVSRVYKCNFNQRKKRRPDGLLAAELGEYDPVYNKKYVKECIKRSSPAWDGVDVEEFVARQRGRTLL